MYVECGFVYMWSLQLLYHHETMRGDIVNTLRMVRGKHLGSSLHFGLLNHTWTHFASRHLVGGNKCPYFFLNELKKINLFSNYN